MSLSKCLIKLLVVWWFMAFVPIATNAQIPSMWRLDKKGNGYVDFSGCEPVRTAMKPMIGSDTSFFRDYFLPNGKRFYLSDAGAFLGEKRLPRISAYFLDSVYFGDLIKADIKDTVFSRQSHKFRIEHAYEINNNITIVLTKHEDVELSVPVTNYGAEQMFQFSLNPQNDQIIQPIKQLVEGEEYYTGNRFVAKDSIMIRHRYVGRYPLGTHDVFAFRNGKFQLVNQLLLKSNIGLYPAEIHELSDDCSKLLFRGSTISNQGEPEGEALLLGIGNFTQDKKILLEPIDVFRQKGFKYRGVAMSSNGRFVYFIKSFAKNDTIIQFDIENNSYKKITVPKGCKISFHNAYFAPNGKLYIDQVSQNFTIIEKPNEPLVAKNIKWCQNNGSFKGNLLLARHVKHYSHKPVKIIPHGFCQDSVAFSFDGYQGLDVVSWKLFADEDSYQSFLDDTLKVAANGKTSYKVCVLAGANGKSRVGVTDSFVLFTNPAVAFEVDTHKWCQWVALDLQNSSYSEIDSQHFTWKLLLNDVVHQKMEGRNSRLRFDSSGNYQIRLVHQAGPCKDSVDSSTPISILSAPKPGFRLSHDTICTVQMLRLEERSVGTVSKRWYQWSNGFSSNRKKHGVKLAHAGPLIIQQQLEGPSGCVTQYSDTIDVYEAISTQYQPVVQYLSHTKSDELVIKVAPDTKTKAYALWGTDSLQMAKTASSSYFIQVDSSARPFEYRISAFDVCGNMSAASKPHRSIGLWAKENQGVTQLNWSPYRGWNGKLAYTVLWYDGFNWYPLESKTDTQMSVDYTKQPDSVLYKVMTYNSHDTTYSNTVKVYNRTTYFLPNAFSPNGDGVNDEFTLHGHQLKQWTCSIWSRTGQRLHVATNEKILWNGKLHGTAVPNGRYFYQLRITNHQGEDFMVNGEVLVLR